MQQIATGPSNESSQQMATAAASSTPTTATTTTTTTSVVPAGNCCAGCREPIRDKFIFSVIDLHWHQDCVQCADCSLKLNERCYTFDGKLYCRLDYWRRFGPKCFACRESIERSELVQRIEGNRVYHLKCFTCNDCRKQLKAGEQLHLIDGKRLLCKHDYKHHQLAAGNGAPVSASASASASAPAAPLSGKASFYEAKQANPSQPQVKSERHSLSAGEEEEPEELDESQLAGELDDIDDVDDDASQLDAGNLTETLLDDELHSAGFRAAPAHLYLAPGSGVKGEPGEPEAATLSKSLKNNANNNSSTSSLVDQGDDLVDANGKRRGPRTTIKPKQLETLRHAFETAPKPSRHIREQLASETGLNMRVIQVWFQNRRSKERRMKNSNGSVRRNFFRSSSRRSRVGPIGGSGAQSIGAQQQQSLIANRNSAGGAPAHQRNQNQNSKQQREAQAQLSPMEPGEQPVQQQQQQQSASAGSIRQHNPPSEFGGSSSGGFTYFSDSSNQGDDFAINTAGSQQATQQQQQQQQNQRQQQPAQAQYIGQGGPQDQATLMALESPSNGGQSAQQQANLNGQQAAARSSQQYSHQSIKNTPPPPIYHSGGPPGHMAMGGPLQTAGPAAPPMGGQAHPHQQHPHPLPHPHPMQHQHQHQHPLTHPLPHPLPHQHLANQMVMQPGGPAIGAMNGLLGSHPQGHSVVQW